MLPLAVSLRRLAGRSAAMAMRRAVPTASRSSVRVFAAVPGHASTAWYSSAPLDFGTDGAAVVELEDGEDVVLEPLQGFVDQKPIADFDLSQETQRNLERAGVTHLFPVQTQSFDVMMKGSDIMGRSKTGSGKTLAFALPTIETILANRKNTRNPQALVLLPTRELAQQVHDQVQRVAPQLRTINVVGGVSYTVQENQLRRGVDILVGTPGRIMDLVDKGSLSLEDVDVSVLDEADMMLKFGFQEAVETILGWVPDGGQTLVNIDLVGDNDNHVPATVAHKAILAPSRDRIQVLENVLRLHAHDGQTLVFTETKQEADEIANSLPGQDARALHGDLSQGMRTSTMNGFRNGHVKTLVCTDIAARGLDIANVELVVQYRLPSDKESFVHRAGRTGRAGRSGTNIVFFDRNDTSDVLDFERRYKFKFAHAAPPRPEQMMTGALEDVNKQLSSLPKANAQLFDEAAQAMIEQQGPGVLSAALALLCGFDSKKLTSLSMLTGRHRMQTVEVEGVQNARDLNRLLASFMDDRVDIHPVEGGKLVFDIPQGKIEALQAHLTASSPDEEVSVTTAVEFPRLVVDRAGRNNNNFGGRFGQRGGRNNSRGFSNNRFGNNRREGGNNRFGGNKGDNNWKRNDRDGGNRRNGGRDFDSSFSKGRSSNRNNFGRFTDGW
ncbi:DEAD/DEAH box RNA helicase, putative [Phytophthora infestans T30-4]|uniref:DEAD/DEAH box RNA helicase, putative n=1 Tax=Phytophthora infestans (strain T30-4) TaxID=403677 RepID=D0NCU5_PHYIT|nr:DEAD/DEAH box RNA helicase, putative [Phytophthora infestans T30-4]EEY55809.1 DEAD/DEAH box RNA helicase, putative [Phytophthora infestans T30-4]|eukprot:XP_002903385.1 DEAD/DEAH box RNA helicase, putative [Phytophthora infestans T30-4]